MLNVLPAFWPVVVDPPPPHDVVKIARAATRIRRGKSRTRKRFLRRGSLASRVMPKIGSDSAEKGIRQRVPEAVFSELMTNLDVPPLAPGLIWTGSNPHASPAGTPEHESVTSPLKSPLCEIAWMI
jgi:hypothetical protein